MTSLKITSVLAASFLLVASVAANAADSSSSTAPPQGWSTPNMKTADSTTMQKTAAATAKPRTAASIECSKEADAKGLHGKERKAFRASCKSAIKAGKPVPDKTSSLIRLPAAFSAVLWLRRPFAANPMPLSA